MRLRTSLELYTVALLGTLGLGCGGNAESDGDLGGSGLGGAVGSGGSVGVGGSLATGGNGSGGGTTQNRFPCVNPTPMLGPDGQPTGYVQCDGFIHRVDVRACASALPRTTTTCPSDGGCQSDTQCTERPFGHCSSGEGGQVIGCYCQYGCSTDADCAMGQICLCGEPVGRCVPASCTSDADCTGESLCKSYVVNPGCGGTGFACQTAADECGGSDDCMTGQLCSIDPSGRHWCAGIQCAAGRPFLVSGLERLAAPARRGDWQGEWRPALEGLSVSERAWLAAHWQRVGLMEHASIAAFARFALELLALGAPAEMVQAASRAMSEETEHARDCFALASAYAGRHVGPGRLDVTDALCDLTLEHVAVTTIEEGCIGETVASIEAAEAAEHARDPVVRALLEKIAIEERRHATLAWQFVHWALERGDAAVRAGIARRFDQLTNVAATTDCAPSDLLEHGVVSERERAAIKNRVLAEVIKPCAAALLAEANREPHDPLNIHSSGALV